MIIPRITTSIAYIISEMEELEREDTFRLRRIKQKKMKSKSDGAGEHKDDAVVKEETTKAEDAKSEKDKKTKTKDASKTADNMPKAPDGPKINKKATAEAVVQPKEAAGMGDLIILKPPDDKIDLRDTFIPPPDLNTNIAGVGKKLEIPEIKKDTTRLEDIKEIKSEFKEPQIEQLVDDDIETDKVNLKMYSDIADHNVMEFNVQDSVDKLETGEWFETPSRLDNTGKIREDGSGYSKRNKFKEVVGSKIEMNALSSMQLPLRSDDSIMDIDKRALASLYKDIDNNYYKPTIDDLFSKHDITMDDSTSLQDIEILEQSLVDLESINFSVDSKGKIVSKQDSGQSSPVITIREDKVPKSVVKYDEDGRIIVPITREHSIKWQNDDHIEEQLVAQLDDKLDNNDENTKVSETEKNIDKVTDDNQGPENSKNPKHLYSNAERFEDGGNKGVSTSDLATSAGNIPLKADDGLTDIDKRALESLLKDVDSNFYKPTIDDIFSKHDLPAIQESSTKISEHTLVDLESINLSVDSRGKIVPSKQTFSEPLETHKETDTDSKQIPKEEESLQGIPSGKEPSIRRAAENQEDEEDLTTQLVKHIYSKPTEENFEIEEQTGDEKTIESETNKNMSGTGTNMKTNESLEVVDPKMDNKDEKLVVQSKVSYEETEVWTSDTENIPGDQLAEKMETEQKPDISIRPLPKITRSMSEGRLSRISEEDNVNDTTKLSTFQENQDIKKDNDTANNQIRITRDSEDKTLEKQLDIHSSENINLEIIKQSKNKDDESDQNKENSQNKEDGLGKEGSESKEGDHNTKESKNKEGVNLESQDIRPHSETGSDMNNFEQNKEVVTSENQDVQSHSSDTNHSEQNKDNSVNQDVQPHSKNSADTKRSEENSKEGVNSENQDVRLHSSDTNHSEQNKDNSVNQDVQPHSKNGADTKRSEQNNKEGVNSENQDVRLHSSDTNHSEQNKDNSVNQDVQPHSKNGADTKRSEQNNKEGVNSENQDVRLHSSDTSHFEQNKEGVNSENQDVRSHSGNGSDTNHSERNAHQKQD